MAVDDVITSPLLIPTLTTARTTLAQTLKLIDLLSANASAPTSQSLQTTVTSHQKHLLALLAKLRLQTRRAAYLARTTKSETAEARKEVDNLLLQLQNLYYEQRHLLGEIAACEDYGHAFRELPLVEVDEYLDQFPEEGDLSESELMERRIAFEKGERERLEEDRLELVRRKEALVQENARRKEVVKKMDERLEGWVEGLAKLEDELAKEL